jgi:hypothetical protein
MSNEDINITNTLIKFQNDTNWENWSQNEMIMLLKIYHSFCKKEARIYDLIYKYHDCDTWEDIFRDYNESVLEDKSYGVEVAIRRIENLL